MERDNGEFFNISPLDGVIHQNIEQEVVFFR